MSKEIEIIVDEKDFDGDYVRYLVAKTVNGKTVEMSEKDIREYISSAVVGKSLLVRVPSYEIEGQIARVLIENIQSVCVHSMEPDGWNANTGFYRCTKCGKTEYVK